MSDAIFLFTTLAFFALAFLGAGFSAGSFGAAAVSGVVSKPVVAGVVSGASFFVFIIAFSFFRFWLAGLARDPWITPNRPSCKRKDVKNQTPAGWATRRARRASDRRGGAARG